MAILKAFLQFIIMRFQPTQEEEVVAIGKINDGPSDLNFPGLIASGSAWGEAQLIALRVKLLDRLPLARLFPWEYLPGENHESKAKK